MTLNIYSFADVREVFIADWKLFNPIEYKSNLLLCRCVKVFIAEGKFGYIGADPLFSRTHLLVFNKRPLQQTQTKTAKIW